MEVDRGDNLFHTPAVTYLQNRDSCAYLSPGFTRDAEEMGHPAVCFMHIVVALAPGEAHAGTVGNEVGRSNDL